MARFAIQAFALNNTIYGGATGWSLDTGSSVNSDGLDGVQYQTAHHEITRAPSAEITTRSLKDVLTALDDSLDLPQKAFDGTNGLRLVAAKSASGAPGYASGSVHVARTMPRGLIYVSGVRWSVGGKAEMTLRALGKGNGDGLTAAVTESLIALPTQPAADAGFTLSAMLLNNQSITLPNSVDLSIEPNYAQEYLAGQPVPSDIVGAGVQAPLAIALNADIGDLNLGAGTGAVSLVFTKYAHGGGFGTDTVTFTLNGRWSDEQGINGQSNAGASRNLLVRTRYNAATRPLAWALA